MSGLLPGKLSRIASARVPSGSNGECLNADSLAAGLTPRGNRWLAPRNAALVPAISSRKRRVIIASSYKATRRCRLEPIGAAIQSAGAQCQAFELINDGELSYGSGVLIFVNR